MKKELTGVAARVYPVVAPIVEEQGCFVWDVEYVREGADNILRITIDTDAEGGIGIDECERVHRAVDPALDEADPIENSCYLQISSPGVERSLTRPWHIKACAGEKVEARLFAPVDGRKKLTGTLCGFADEEAEEGIVIDIGSGTVTLPFEAVSKLTTVFDFDA